MSNQSTKNKSTSWRMLIIATVSMWVSSFTDTPGTLTGRSAYFAQFQNPKFSENQNSRIPYLGTKPDVNRCKAI